MTYRLPGDDAVATLSATGTLGVLELTSIARGWSVADAMVKSAPITVVDATAACPGKFLIVVTGDLAAVEASVERGIRASGRSLFDSIILSNLAPEVPAAINRVATPGMGDTAAVIETFSAVAAIAAADRAIKHGRISIGSISLLDGIGGKAFAVITGELSDIESAVSAARSAIADDMLVEISVIPEFSPELAGFLPGGR